MITRPCTEVTIGYADPYTPTALDVQTLDLDCGYDSNISTERCETLWLTDIVCAVKRGKGQHQTLHLGPVLARRTSASSAAKPTGLSRDASASSSSTSP